MNSIHLSRIEYVYLLKEKYDLDEENQDKLERVIENGAQFPYTNPCLAQIKLTKTGQKLYKKKYLNRPTPVKIEDDIYYFNCSYDQLVLYFFSFGSEALIISPIHLKESLKKKYADALNAYEQN